MCNTFLTKDFKRLISITQKYRWNLEWLKIYAKIYKLEINDVTNFKHLSSLCDSFSYSKCLKLKRLSLRRNWDMEVKIRKLMRFDNCCTFKSFEKIYVST